MTVRPTSPAGEDRLAVLTLEEAARRLDVPEASMREWLASFHWERRYDRDGHLLLADRDLEFLRLVKSLKDVDRSCESIVRLIEGEPASDLSAIAPSLDDPPPSAAAAPTDREQIESLKAELRDLHARPEPALARWWRGLRERVLKLPHAPSNLC